MANSAGEIPFSLRNFSNFLAAEGHSIMDDNLEGFGAASLTSGVFLLSVATVG